MQNTTQNTKSVKEQLLIALADQLEKISEGAGAKANFESPKNPEHGDLACTAAMALAKALKTPPRTIAEKLKQALLETEQFKKWVNNIEIAGAGFLNIKLTNAAKQNVIKQILNLKEKYGHKENTQNTPQKIILEFVSANPTGPLHVGHGRQAALGDAICNLLKTQGYDVYKEFYYNDAGVQIENLAKSVQLRGKGINPNEEGWSPDSYAGDYIKDIANDYLNKKSIYADGETIIASGDINNINDIRKFAVAYLRAEQDKDLSAFRLKFDNYYLESSLYTTGRVEKAVQMLKDAGQTYEEGGALWLKTTDYGDDKDRVMRKTDGGYTYFVPDVAYHITKWQRGFTNAINIQGTDHHGTIARVRAGLQAANIGINKNYPAYILHTMVRVVRGGQEVKISKRAGSYVTLRDLIDWTSTDAVRFFLLSRKPDTEYTFDVDNAIAKNNDNPVYYVQYAHARICSILDTWQNERGGKITKLEILSDEELAPLDTPAAAQVLLKLSQYPDMLANAARDNAPHDVVFYLRELAAAYHAYYDAERILVDDENVQTARIALIASVASVIKNALLILGVSAPNRM